MRVGILGAGAVAYGTAAYLHQHGHAPALWSPSGVRTRALAEGAPLTATGAIEARFSPQIAATAADAVAGADAVLLALPANGHKAVMDALAPHVAPGQPVIVSSHASFGALYLSRLLAARGVGAPIVAWGTTLTAGRQGAGAAPTGVAVSTVRGRIDLATLPLAEQDEGLAVCNALFGERFVPRDGLLAIALSNLNPQNHMGIALCNLTRMERGEAWAQGENVTPAVGRLLEALDAERLAIAEALGLKVRTIFEHFALSFHVPEDGVHAMNQRMHAEGRGGTGPASADSRYVLEDVPYGLVPTTKLGRLVDRPAVLHEAGVRLFSALFGRDFAAENDLLAALDLDGLSIEDLQALARDGFTPE